MDEQNTQQAERDRAADAADLNLLIRYLARRDLAALTPDALFAARGFRQADLLILLGGITSPAFAETVAGAFHAGIARRLMLVGGAGHSTQNLRDTIAAHPRYGVIPTAGRPEADMLADLFSGFLGIERQTLLLENASTHCGNNASLALSVVRAAGPLPAQVVLVQDPIMQRRSGEAFRHEWRAGTTVFTGFAPAVPLLIAREGRLAFADAAHAAFYRMNGFLDLVMGEIPRLRDDENGYGPRGRGFIGHVDIPADVLAAFARLLPSYGQHVRR
jgi:uncharacterized SAM-binding protein YcdF (DUF218 family)